MPSHSFVTADRIPEPYRTLLVHDAHMTVTVEQYYGQPVGLRVLARRQAGDDYARAILLVLPDSGQAVQFGIVRIDLSACPPRAREEVTAGVAPLGRILIAHNVLRRIETIAFVQIRPTADWCKWFGVDASPDFYGRLAVIHCNERPAVELLEVVRP